MNRFIKTPAARQFAIKESVVVSTDKFLARLLALTSHFTTRREQFGLISKYPS